MAPHFTQHHSTRHRKKPTLGNCQVPLSSCLAIRGSEACTVLMSAEPPLPEPAAALTPPRLLQQLPPSPSRGAGAGRCRAALQNVLCSPASLESTIRSKGGGGGGGGGEEVAKSRHCRNALSIIDAEIPRRSRRD